MKIPRVFNELTSYIRYQSRWVVKASWTPVFNHTCPDSHDEAINMLSLVVTSVPHVEMGDQVHIVRICERRRPPLIFRQFWDCECHFASEKKYCEGVDYVSKHIRRQITLQKKSYRSKTSKYRLKARCLYLIVIWFNNHNVIHPENIAWLHASRRYNHQSQYKQQHIHT